MSTRKKVFIVGAGFIGTEVLDLLHEEGYSITALSRRKEHAAQLEKEFRVRVVMGQLDDHVIIAEQTTSHDIVIHTATADHLVSAQAILEGVKARAAQGLSTIYIHTSGTSVLDDNANGEFKSDRIYHDKIRSEIDSVPDSAPHREIDLAIVKVQKELGAKAKIAIMTPPLIYGCKQKHPSSVRTSTLEPASANATG